LLHRNAATRKALKPLSRASGFLKIRSERRIELLKWKILTLVGVSLGVAGVGWGFAQQQKAIGFYELRIYTAQPGKRDALAARFATRTAAIYAKHGITNVGYWIPQESDSELGISAENTFIYIRGYPSKVERDRRLKAAHDDPEFAEVVTRQEQNPQTRLIVKAHNIDMVPNGSYSAVKIVP
jgi:hypothetical protein